MRPSITDNQAEIIACLSPFTRRVTQLENERAIYRAALEVILSLEGDPDAITKMLAAARLVIKKAEARTDNRQPYV